MKRIQLVVICIACLFYLSCSVKINVCEIAVWQGINLVDNETGSYDFGTKLRSEVPTDVMFIIENLRSYKLAIEDITIASGDVDDFVIDSSQIVSPLAIGGLTSFTVTFSPQSLGMKSAVIEIVNSDKDNNPFTFTVIGYAIDPIMLVQQNTAVIENIDGVYDFGIGNIDEVSDSVVFTISNTGIGTLEIFELQIAGLNYQEFLLDDSMLEKAIPEGESSTFSIQFAPTSEKDKSAVVTILSNDEDQIPFTFSLAGFAGSPEINVKQGIDDIPNKTGVYNFGEYKVDTTSEAVVFTIINEGSGVVFINGLSMQGDDIDDFTIDDSAVASHLNPAEETSFTITFNPKTSGPKSIEIVIANNDTDENPYTFTVTGEALDPVIEVRDPVNKEIMNDGYYYFGKQELNQTVTGTFLVKNIGYGMLELNGSPLVEITGRDASAFTVSKMPLAYIDTALNTTFEIKFTATEERNYCATVTIANNDLDKDPFVFEVRARVRVVEFDFNGDGIDDIIVGTCRYTFASSDRGAVYVYLGSDNPASVISTNSAIRFYGKEDRRFDGFGMCVSSAGDFNGDGCDDIIVSAISEDSINEDAGAVYMFFGSHNPSSTYYAENADITFCGKYADERFGCSIASAKDLNDDGIDDIIIGTGYYSTSLTRVGRVCIYFGKSSTIQPYLYSDDADVKITGVDSYAQTGYSVASAGDFNNDGIQDIVIGTTYYNNQINRKGEAYIFYGKSSFSSNLLTTDADIKLIGRENHDGFGGEVSCIGDFNNDCVDDIIIFAWDDNYGGLSAGAAFIFFGSNNPNTNLSASSANVVFQGTDGNNIDVVSYCGDFNHDGLEDIIIRFVQPADNKAAVYFGRNNPGSLYKFQDANIVFDSDNADNFGTSFSSAGDFNNDGKDDVVLGDCGNNLDSNSYAFMFYGRENPASLIKKPSANIKFNAAGLDEQFGRFLYGGKH